MELRCESIIYQSNSEPSSSSLKSSCKTKGIKSPKTNLIQERNWRGSKLNIRAGRSLKTYLFSHLRDVVKPRDTIVDKLAVRCGTRVDSRVPKILKLKQKLPLVCT